MRLLDKTILTEDEGWDLPDAVAEQVKRYLATLKMDGYNAQYVVRITVDTVDGPAPPIPDED